MKWQTKIVDIFLDGLKKMEAYSKIEIMDLDIDEDFQIMDDVFSIEKDEEMTLVLEEETYVALKIT